jgi:hypothetical protein
MPAHSQAQVELKVLEHLRTHDPEGSHHVIHIHEHFVFRNHLCITFELLSINLYEFIKANKFQGLELALIRRFAAQMLVSLKCVSFHVQLPRTCLRFRAAAQSSTSHPPCVLVCVTSSGSSGGSGSSTVISSLKMCCLCRRTGLQSRSLILAARALLIRQCTPTCRAASTVLLKSSWDCRMALRLTCGALVAFLLNLQWATQSSQVRSQVACVRKTSGSISMCWPGPASLSMCWPGPASLSMCWPGPASPPASDVMAGGS